MARKYLQPPAEIKKKMANRVLPVCPHCGIRPTYTGHPKFCEKNPEAEENRRKVREKAKKDYVDHGIKEKVIEGTRKNRDKVSAQSSLNMKKLHAEKRAWTGGNTKKRTEKEKKQVSDAMKRVHASRGVKIKGDLNEHNIVVPVLGKEFSLFDDDFFKKKQVVQSDLWVEVDDDLNSF